MNWLQILREQVAAHNDAKGRGGPGKVGSLLGLSRSTVSLVLAGKYPAGSTDRVAARVIARFGEGHVHCPHLRGEISIGDCGNWRKRPMPRAIPADLRHWQACRNCPVGKALAEGKTPAAANADQPTQEKANAR